MLWLLFLFQFFVTSLENERAIRFLSRYVYDHPKIDESTMSIIIDATITCSKFVQQNGYENPDKNFASLFHIVTRTSDKVILSCASTLFNVFILKLITDVFNN